MKAMLLAALLFVVLFAGFRYGLDAWWGSFSRRRRLQTRRSTGMDDGDRTRWRRLEKPYGHIADMLGAVGWNIRPASIAAMSVVLAVTGLTIGGVLFRSVQPALLLGAMLGILPYLSLRMRLVSRQMATRLEFLPAVELFYQSYLVTGSRQIRTALQKTVEERRLPGEVQGAFEQLYRHLSVGGDEDAGIRRFALSFGHIWADYFGSIVKVAMTEGCPVGDNLRELLADMRKAQLANQQERHRMLEIRIANYTPALFLGLFVAINFKLNPEASYRYYVLDTAGRAMLLNATALLFGSLIMGLALSRRKL